MTEKKLNIGKGKKVQLNVTIDEINMNLLQEIKEGYNDTLSGATNEVLDHFRTEIWEKDIVAKSLDEVEKEESNK